MLHQVETCLYWLDIWETSVYEGGRRKGEREGLRWVGEDICHIRQCIFHEERVRNKITGMTTHKGDKRIHRRYQ